MGRKDTVSKKYMRDPKHFADFFNGFIYHGEEVIKAEDLSEVDTSSILLIPYSKGYKHIAVQKYRDMLKQAILMHTMETYYLFLGLEDQSDIHYAMPVKNMIYDGLMYGEQVSSVAKYNRENGLCENRGEFLSGFTKRDKLIPIITVTLYWGTKPWDAPTTLKGMLGTYDKSQEPLINDYDCHLFSIIDQETFPDYKTDLKELFQLLSARNNKGRMKIMAENPEYQNVEYDTAVMMSEFAGIKKPRKNKEGKVNMCKALVDWAEESKAIGEKIGEERGKEIGEKIGEERGKDDALVTAIRAIMKNEEKTFEECCISMELSEKDMARYRTMI